MPKGMKMALGLGLMVLVAVGIVWVGRGFENGPAGQQGQPRDIHNRVSGVHGRPCVSAGPRRLVLALGRHGGGGWRPRQTVTTAPALTRPLTCGTGTPIRSR